MLLSFDSLQFERKTGVPNNIVLRLYWALPDLHFLIFGSGYFQLRNADAFKFGFKRLSVETIYSLTERDKIRERGGN